MRLNISNHQKESNFKYPGNVNLSFGRKMSTAFIGNAVYSVNYCENKGRSSVIIIKNDKGSRSEKFIYTEGFCHRPSVATFQGRLIVCWNEFCDEKWFIRYAELDESLELQGQVRDVTCSGQMFLEPDICTLRDDIYIVWSRVDGKSLRIFLTCKKKDSFEEIGFISDVNVYANRPKIVSSKDKLLISWDQYTDGKFEVAFAEFLPGDEHKIQTISDEKNSCFCPQISATGKNFILSYIVTKDVSDDLGVLERDTGISAAIVRDNIFERFSDISNKQDDKIIAYLRDGLLPSNIYKGYLGQRRGHFPVITESGDIYILKEVRPEKDFTSIEGKLVAKKYLCNGSWSDEYIIKEGYYGYSISKNIQSESIAVSFFDYAGSDSGILQSEFCKLDNNCGEYTTGDDWQRWQPIAITPSKHIHNPIKHNNKQYKIFWSDTHCHSGFSGDAEGEVDELIHFARDKAGLDAICVIDNDYYPYKSLSQAEWHIHQGYSRLFSQEGEFLVFTGYEFTFHDSSLKPDFNHRIIMYPDGEGKLCRRIDESTNSMEKLYEALQDEKVIIYPHHCTYKLLDNKESGVEVCSSWRVCLEETDFTVTQLKNGAKIGFIGSSDTHRLVPGLGGSKTGVYAENLTPACVYDAYKNRRLIATQGHNVICDFRVDDYFIGEHGQAEDSPEIYCKVLSYDEDIEFVNIIRDGDIIKEFRPDANECEFKFTDDSLESGNHFYYARIKLKGEPSFNFCPDQNAHAPFTKESRYPHNLSKAKGVFAWTSPIWIEKK